MLTSDLSVISLYFLSLCIIYSSSLKQQHELRKLTDVKETEITDGGVIKHVEDVIHYGHSKIEKIGDGRQVPTHIYAEKYDHDNYRTRNQTISQIAMEGGRIIQPAPVKMYAENYDHDNYRTTNHTISQIAMEGGGVIQSASTLGNPTLAGNSTITEDGTHTTGSKGRKGVENQVPSVVARKGVNQEGTDHSNVGNNSLISENPAKESTVPMNTEKPSSLNFTEKQAQGQTIQLSEKNPKVSHAKKPDFVSDEGDMEDNDRYIKSSTTGEDYVVIGVVIVIGIWFSVFGALIFYRRAGEYWDRRHYRRMDFLVEGMYND